MVGPGRSLGVGRAGREEIPQIPPIMQNLPAAGPPVGIFGVIVGEGGADGVRIQRSRGAFHVGIERDVAHIRDRRGEANERLPIAMIPNAQRHPFQRADGAAALIKTIHVDGGRDIFHIRPHAG